MQITLAKNKRQLGEEEKTMELGRERDHTLLYERQSTIQ